MGMAAYRGESTAAQERKQVSVGDLQGYLTENLGMLRQAFTELAQKVMPVRDQREQAQKPSDVSARPYYCNNPVGQAIIEQIGEVEGLAALVRTVTREVEL